MSYGADDFVTKPYNPTILLLRISAVLKRSAGKTSSVQTYHDAQVSTMKGSISRNGAEQILTKNEMIIFQLLLDRVYLVPVYSTLFPVSPYDFI